jgi:thiol-disulfide isomerase/thioredoxin
MYNKKNRDLIKYLLVLILFIVIWEGCTTNDSNNLSTLKIEYADELFVESRINEREGKILFINVWATWCVPCVAEFPELVKIYKDYNKQVEFLSLSVDFGDKADSLVSSFMKTQKAEFPVYIIKEASSEKVINLLNREWSGAIPATFIYDRNGALKKFIPGAQSYTQFKQSIDSLLLL